MRVASYPSVPPFFSWSLSTCPLYSCLPRLAPCLSLSPPHALARSTAPRDPSSRLARVSLLQNFRGFSLPALSLTSYFHYYWRTHRRCTSQESALANFSCSFIAPLRTRFLILWALMLFFLRNAKNRFVCWPARLWFSSFFFLFF